MHMPGGKRRIGSLAKNDMTEITGFDDLHDPKGIIKDLERGLADLWNAPEAFLSVNGSTAMIESAICAAMRYCPDGRILAASNCHLSVWHGIEMSGCMHRIIYPEAGRYPFALEADPKAIEKALEDDPDIKVLVITSPTYEGVISDTREIYEITQKHNCTLIIDEAHGAHLGLPYCGDEAWGDLIIKSIHKTLSAPTQTAVLLKMSDRVKTEDIRHYIDIYESTSPSYLLMSGVSEMVEYLHSADALGDWKAAVDGAVSRLTDLKNIVLFDHPSKDFSKLVFLCDGNAVADILRKEYDIEVEYAGRYHLTAMTGIGDNTDTLSRFADAVISIDKGHPELKLSLRGNIKTPEHITEKSLYEASRTPSESIDASEAAGRISAEAVYSYPPGIPVILPGDRLTSEQLCFAGEKIRVLR